MADNLEIVEHFSDGSSVTITIYQEKNAISPHGTTYKNHVLKTILPEMVMEKFAGSSRSKEPLR